MPATEPLLNSARVRDRFIRRSSPTCLPGPRPAWATPAGGRAKKTGVGVGAADGPGQPRDRCRAAAAGCCGGGGRGAAGREGAVAPDRWRPASTRTAADRWQHMNLCLVWANGEALKKSANGWAQLKILLGPRPPSHLRFFENRRHGRTKRQKVSARRRRAAAVRNGAVDQG